MQDNAKQSLILFCLMGIFLIPNQTLNLYSQGAEAGGPKTLDELLEKRSNFKNNERGKNVDRLVNILIVPGHDDEVWGTEFRGQKEVEFNRDVTQRLYQYLLNEPGINPVLASTEKGYNDILQTYFDLHQSQIEKFIRNAKRSFSTRIEKDELDLATNLHNAASDDVAFKLYGINSWVNDQKFDLVIHVHFNDYRGRKRDQVGEYEGFSIYTPGTLFGNHGLSQVIAESVFDELARVRPVSNFPLDTEGIIESHELIAIGSHDTLQAGSILIEYGYIYESAFTDPEKRAMSFDQLAYATYAGITEALSETPKTLSVLPVSAAK